ncbi:hypothetical protein F4820DRAFT_167149 [Hypoxylon rubiginosum]|uniref:Uncharacterized protein n=1 Tax=Hypoxylon rubiginosum TaxID=110542 RepID=A0ACB9YJP6_9PEZI|nr:hypothetical protein F4820DRAFT_167149 [Hypoxylon rubiginosum]
MSWRSQGITGSNNIPLGKSRRFGGEPEDAPTTRDNGSDGFSASNGDRDRDRDLKRGRSPEPRTDADGTRRRKKRNRWGEASENKAAGLMGLPTAILANMTSEQLEAYTLHLRIEEISQKLRINDVVPADGDRSPSPPPQYDNHGRRVNTREYRYRKRLEDERHKLVEKAMKTIPNYHPPQDYPPATWLEIVPTGRRVLVGVMMVLPALLVVLAVGMPSIANTSNSCKNSEVAPADPLLVSKLVLALSITVAAAMRSLGNEALQVLQPRGAHATTNRTAKAALLLLGATVIVAMTTARAAITTEVKVKAKAKAKTTMVVLRRPARHLGIKLLPDSRSTPAIPAIQATAQLPAWDHLPVLHRLEVL